MVPYPYRTGRSLQEAITDVLGRGITTFIGEYDGTALQPRKARASLAGRSGIRPRVRSPAATARLSLVVAEPVVAAMGPIGRVYVNRTLGLEERDRLARILVERAQIPLVAIVDDQGQVRVWTAEGRFVLPEDAPRLFAPGHPFLDEITPDFITLCRRLRAFRVESTRTVLRLFPRERVARRAGLGGDPCLCLVAPGYVR